VQTPKSFIHQIVIILLGKHGKLSGKQIYKEARKEKECSILVLPKYSSSIYKALKTVEEQGFIEQVDEKRVRGTLERFYSLTQKGKKAFNELLDVFPIVELLPDFLEMRSACLKCKPDQVEDCWKIFSKNLEIAISDVKDIFPNSQPRAANYLKQVFKTPGHLREFIFWLKMLKLPKKRLEEYFADQMRVFRVAFRSHSD